MYTGELLPYPRIFPPFGIFRVLTKDGNNVEDEYEDPIRSLPDEDVDNNPILKYELQPGDKVTFDIEDKGEDIGKIAVNIKPFEKND